MDDNNETVRIMEKGLSGSDNLKKGVAKAVDKSQTIIEKDENYDILVELMEDNPTLFYDTSELDDLSKKEKNDCVTQKKIIDWESWLEDYMKEKKE